MARMPSALLSWHACRHGVPVFCLPVMTRLSSRRAHPACCHGVPSVMARHACLAWCVCEAFDAPRCNSRVGSTACVLTPSLADPPPAPALPAERAGATAGGAGGAGSGAVHAGHRPSGGQVAAQGEPEPAGAVGIELLEGLRGCLCWGMCCLARQLACLRHTCCTREGSQPQAGAAAPCSRDPSAHRPCAPTPLGGSPPSLDMAGRPGILWCRRGRRPRRCRGSRWAGPM